MPRLQLQTRSQILSLLFTLSCALSDNADAAPDFDGSLSDAVRLTMERAPAIAQSRRRLQLEEANVLIASGAFDSFAHASYLDSNTPVAGVSRPGQFGHVRSDITTWQVGVTQDLRSGMALSTTATVIRTSETDAASIPSHENLSLNLTVPLLRGRGRAVTTANERAAIANRDAAASSHVHDVAVALLRSIQAYWDYSAATATLAVVTSAEAQSSRSLADSRELAERDELAVSEIKKFQVKLLRETVARIGAEQALVAAREALGIAIGLTGDQIRSIPAPTSALELIEIGSLSAEEAAVLSAQLATQAQELRSDQQALQLRLHAARALLLAAEDARRPRLDLVVGVGYDQLSDSMIGVVAHSGSDGGANAHIGLSYAWPMHNLDARGQALLRSAQLESMEIDHHARAGLLVSAIALRLGEVRVALAQMQMVDEQLLIQREIYADEQRKYRFGLATLLDLFSSEAQLMDVQLDGIRARHALAQSVVALHFESGTLLDPDAPLTPPSMAQLLTLPPLLPHGRHHGH